MEPPAVLTLHHHQPHRTRSSSPMGCNTSRDGVSGARPPRRRADPAKLCRERAALARAVADRRSALADAHAAYFRSLEAVAGALRGFAANALAAAPTTTTTAPAASAVPPSPLDASAAANSSPSPSSAVSPLARSFPDVNLNAAPSPNNLERGVGGCGGKKASSSSTTRRYTRSSSAVHMVVCENPYASPWYAEREATYYGERPAPSPPAVSPWDYYDPFVHCDGFVEDYYNRSREQIRKMEADTSSKPSSSRAAADQNAKGERPASSNSINGCSKEGVKRRWASLNLKGSVLASGANGEKGKQVSISKDAEPSNGSSRSKQEPNKKTSPTSSSSTQKKEKKKTVVIEEEEPTRSPTRVAGDDSDSHAGNPAVPSPAISSPLSPMHLGTRSVTAAMDEVYWLFIEAANRGAAVSRVLGTGKAVTRRRNKLRAVLTVSTSSCHPKPRRWRSTSSSSSLGTGRSNDVHKLSSILEKLWVWEKKLYGEIKEKDKLLKQYKKMLKSLNEQQGTESPAIDSTQMSVNLLRSKISVSTSTANALSSIVEKIRDEELYPQLADLLARFRTLWKAVLDCHEKQLSAILGSEIHRLKAVTLSQSSVASMASEELERELVNWRRSFEKWIGSQKSFAEALNRWLKKRLPDQEHGVSQPASFVISEQWLQATETKVVSMAEALRAMDHFSRLVHKFRKSQEDEHRRKQKADRASSEYHAKREDLKVALGLITDLDIAAVMENPCYRHDERVRDLVKARRRMDEERFRHEKILRQADIAASAALPLGLVPMLQQIICFFQGNLQ